MKIVLSVAAFFIIYSTMAQYSLPKVTTTQSASLRDLSIGVPNENWFVRKIDGVNAYSIIFKNTPVGIKHAFDKYYELRVKYATDECKNESMISSLAIKNDKTYDYEMLSLTIKNESSEIKIHCSIDDPKLLGLHLNSSANFILLSLNEKSSNPSK